MDIDMMEAGREFQPRILRMGEIPALPVALFCCPICRAEIVIEEITEWERTLDGNAWQVTSSGFTLSCATEPDLESDEWEDWNNGHWSAPYVDWLPLRSRVALWLQTGYRFVEKEAQDAAR